MKPDQIIADLKTQLEAALKDAATNAELAKVIESNRAQLESEVNQLTNDLKIQADARIGDGERIQQLEMELEISNKKVESLKETLDDTMSTVYILKDLLAEKPAASGEKEKFEYVGNGKTYEILGSVNIPNKGIRSPLEILADKDAQAWLVEKGSGIVREVK